MEPINYKNEFSEEIKSTKIEKQRLTWQKAKETDDMFKVYTSTKHLSYTQDKEFPRPTLQRQSSMPNLHRKMSDSFLKSRPAKRPKLLSIDDIKKTGVFFQRDLDEKSGALWKCIKRMPAPEGGYLYLFKLRPEYDDTKEKVSWEKMRCITEGRNKVKTIYPAIEPMYNDLRAINPEWIKSISGLKKKEYITNMTVGRIMSEGGGYTKIRQEVKTQLRQIVELFKIVLELGYKYKEGDSGLYLSLPDLRVLEIRWKKLQEKYPGLSDLGVGSAKGVSESRLFINGNVINHCLLSSSKEFLHDHMTHVLAMINLKYTIWDRQYNGSGRFQTHQTFEQYHNKFTKFVNSVCRKYEIAEKFFKVGKINMEEDTFKKSMDQMWIILASIVDRITSHRLLGENEKLANEAKNDVDHTFLKRQVQAIIGDSDWKAFLMRLYIKRAERTIVVELKAQGFSGDDLKKEVAKILTDERKSEIKRVEEKNLDLLPTFLEKLIEWTKEFDAGRFQ